MGKYEEDVIFYADVIHKTDKAILVCDGEEEIWLPLSQIEYHLVKGNTYEIIIPEWLAKDKEII